MIYAIDFDGTIVENRYPEIGELKPEAEKFIRALQERGDKWILWTIRGGDKLEEAVKFLESHGLKPDAVNDNLPEVKAKWPSNPNPRKIFADVYIDDRNAGGVKWPEIQKTEEIKHEIPAWVKVGRVVYNPEYKKFYRIIDVEGGTFITARCLGNQGALGCHYSQWREARVVPWTFRNAPDTHVKVKGINAHGYVDVISLDFDDFYDSGLDKMAHFWSVRRQESFRADRYTDGFEQLNGMPCGTLEWRDGDKWIKEGENDND